MWSPTHVQVLVKRAKGLKVKGKDGTNDAFVTIGLGKEKFRTSTKEKAMDPIEWMEQCELSIPTQGNTAEVALTVLHRNLLGVDEFLGQVTLPLRDFDVYERPKTRWYELKCKPGQSKKDYRGELEVRIGFTVKASENLGGSTASLAKKNKGSISSINKVAGNIGGSLMSLGNKEKKNLKKLVKSATHKVEKIGEKTKKSVSSLKLNKDRSTLDSVPETGQWNTLDRRGMQGENLDPGVNSDEEGDDMFKFDTLSQRSTASSLSMNRLGRVSSTSTPYSGSLEAFNVETPPAFRQSGRNANVVNKNKDDEDWDAKIFGKKGDQQPDTLSVASHHSSVSRDGNQSVISHGAASITSQSTLEDTWKPQGLPSYNQAVGKPVHQKKKIIPVQEDIESSPSPESPSSPVNPREAVSSFNKRYGVSASTVDLASVARDQENKKKTLGLKLKNSYSSLFDLSKIGRGKGFKDKVEENKSGRRNSVESNSSRHSRTHSDGSFGPPNGTRVVLGRETSPIPRGNSNIPQDLLAKYAGKSNQELIELVVGMERRLEDQTKRVGDLEDYIDALLIRVMEVAPVLLQKDLNTTKSNIRFEGFNSL